MQLLDLAPGQTIRIGRDICLTVVTQSDGSIGFDIETISHVQVLPAELIGLELHQLQVLAANDF
ncbi:hypothetical protein [Schlesneria sp. T3-172]|uniref:hypothetical protein n=1 Tax=Schlesneria sphaerica TaxID=3373610 RepID=UPI0037C99C30